MGSLKDDKYTKKAQSRLTRWADKLLPFDFIVDHLLGKKMGFVDYLSRHPSVEPVTVSYEDKKIYFSKSNNYSSRLRASNA